MSINKQLSRFYKHQGLTGKHLRSALKYDRKAVRVNRPGWVAADLSRAFCWTDSPQGFDYWHLRDLFLPD